MAKVGSNGQGLGEHLDMTRVRVGQLKAEGVFSRLEDGSFYKDVCRFAYIRWLRGADRRVEKSKSAERMLNACADDLELRIEERTKALVKEAQAEAVAVIDEIGGGLRSDLMALPARVTNDIRLRLKLEQGRFEEAFGAASK